MILKRIKWLPLLALLLFGSCFAEEERKDGFFNIVDGTGKLLHQTVHALKAGDEFIDEKNQLWRLGEVVGDRVKAELVEQVKLPAAVFPSRFSLQGGGGKKGVIGIYHSHSDESYVPTSGTASKHWGDVYRVGEALKTALEKEGFTVHWSENNHNPHDGLAYKRSRTTVFELLKTQPQALIDIHRDAVPLSAYETSIKGDPAAKVMIVVGKQNQNREANLEFAKAIKANADARHPGIVKGILFAQGNYNQDLGPRTILLEFGTYKNSLEAARRSAHEWAHIISAAVAGTGPSTRGQKRSQSIISSRSLFWMLGIVVVIGVLYLWLSAGSWSGAIDRLKNIGTEFGSAFFSRKKPPNKE